VSLTEKTLELNIIHEFLTQFQTIYSKAFALGTTLRQEGSLGYDSRILGTLNQSWTSTVFQFKRAYDHFGSGTTETYEFEINNNGKRDQHSLLWRMCRGSPDIALYAFPLIDSHLALQSRIPNLLTNTAFMDTTDVPMSWISSRSHSVRVFPSTWTAQVLSEPKPVRLRRFEDLFNLPKKERFGVSISVMRENLKKPLYVEEYLESKRSQSRSALPLEVKSRRPRFTFSIFPSLDATEEWSL